MIVTMMSKGEEEGGGEIVEVCLLYAGTAAVLWGRDSASETDCAKAE